MEQEDSYVCSVQISGNRVPCIVLYRDRQLREIKAFHFDSCHGCVWSFDKTFNLGLMYVTVSTYTNQALNRGSTGSSPVFFGPMFIHGHSDTDTFNTFSGRLASKIWTSANSVSALMTRRHAQVAGFLFQRRCSAGLHAPSETEHPSHAPAT